MTTESSSTSYSVSPIRQQTLETLTKKAMAYTAADPELQDHLIQILKDQAFCNTPFMFLDNLKERVDKTTPSWPSLDERALQFFKMWHFHPYTNLYHNYYDR